MIRPAFVLSAAIALVACSSTGGQPGTPRLSTAPSAAGASAGNGSGLEGPLWRLTEYLGPDGNGVQVPDAISASATFDDGTVSGNAGCNDYTGTYTVAGDKLTIGAAGGDQEGLRTGRDRRRDSLPDGHGTGRHIHRQRKLARAQDRRGEGRHDVRRDRSRRPDQDPLGRDQRQQRQGCRLERRHRDHADGDLRRGWHGRRVGRLQRPTTGRTRATRRRSRSGRSRRR